jgi:CDP-glucose 4,6-dehydratase
MGESRSPFWDGRTVLITGAGGFVGSGLALKLSNCGARVVGVIRDSGGERLLRTHGIADEIEIVHGSIGDPGLVQRAINEYEVDTIFHLAAQAMVGVANRSPVSTFESNVAGTWHVLEAARLSPCVKRVIVASSDKAYGDQPTLPYTESTPLGGAYPYDASKVCTDVIARSYGVAYGLPVAVLRCANVYGPGDLNWSRLVPGTIRSVLSGDDPIVRSDGTPERDYIYLSDAVDGYLRVAEQLPRYRGEAFNLGSSRAISAIDLVTLIGAAAGRPDLKPRVLGTATGEISRQCLAAEKARRLLGWEPTTGLAEGLAATIAWYRGYLGVKEPARLQEVMA